MPYPSALEVCSRQGTIHIHVYLYLTLQEVQREEMLISGLRWGRWRWQCKTELDGDQ